MKYQNFVVPLYPIMKKYILLSVFCGWICLLYAGSSTVYTRVSSQPKDGWAGTYLIVYENSKTEAYVWTAEDDKGNYVKATISDGGKIVADNLAAYEVELRPENKGYGIYVKSGDNQGYIYTEAKKNGIEFGKKGAQEFTLQPNSPYVYLFTNTGTQKFCYNATDKRFRIYYDKDKKWTNYKNICLYRLGDTEVEKPKNELDINYVQADFYACTSVWSGTYPYWDVDLTLAAEDSEEALPYIWLQILSYSQYSIAGTYKASWTDGRAGYIHATKSCGSRCAGAYFYSSKAADGYYQVSLIDANIEITKVGKPKGKPNFYTYHITMDITDSNSKVWTFDDDVDVYGVWLECADKKEGIHEDPVPFALESGKHVSEGGTAIDEVATTTDVAHKLMQNGQIVILREDRKYNLLGNRIE